ncbi:MAG: MerR family transcriptional regulator [Saprospiraceae bacterium]|nr:MerR family transcriptional regulator [Saprospiraceae bacterium]
MAVYSIRDLETLSGVKAHTIRMWEKRYGLLTPQRTDTNIRYYLDKDVKMLLNAALLNRHGYKISRIACMTQRQMHDAVLEITEKKVDRELHSDTLTLSMLDLDEEKFDAIIRQRIRDYGFKVTMMEVIFPFLNRLNVLWMTGSIMPVQENYIAGLIRQKIYVAIDSLPHPTQPRGTFVLYLPEDEEHELSSLFIQFLLRDNNFRVINLGRNVSLDDLIQATDIHRPEYIFTLINEGHFKESVKEYIERLSLHCRNSIILLSGIQISQQQIKSRMNWVTFDGLDDILDYINDLP